MTHRSSLVPRPIPDTEKLGMDPGVRLTQTLQFDDLRDHLSSGDVQFIVVGKLQLVETDANHGADLHVECLLLLTLSFLQLHAQKTFLYLLTSPELYHLGRLTGRIKLS